MHSSSRKGAKVRLLALHSTEGIMRAADLRDWKAWAGSSHAAADADGVLLSGARDGFVDYAMASWTLRGGNPVSDNLEMCAHASWTRAQWLACPKLLDRAAFWLAERSKVRDLPLVKLSPADVRAGKSGVIGHVDWTKGMSDGTHWDPGPNFPWDVVLDKAKQYHTPKIIAPEDDDMPSLAELDELITRRLRTEVIDRIVVGNDVPLYRAIQQIHEAVVGGKLARSVVNGVLTEPLNRADQGRPATNMGAVAAWSDTHTDTVVGLLEEILGQLTGTVAAAKADKVTKPATASP